jgi:hypothetical protein
MIIAGDICTTCLRLNANLQRNAVAVLVIAGIATCGVLYYSVRNFALDSSQSGMISEKLRSVKMKKISGRRSAAFRYDCRGYRCRYLRRAVTARSRLAARLREEKTFRNIYEPGGEFSKNGMLYLDPDQLQKLSDNLAAVQPLSPCSLRTSACNFFTMLDKVVEKRRWSKSPGEDGYPLRTD